MTDPRPHIFAGIADHEVTAAVIAVDAGVVTPIGDAVDCAMDLGLSIVSAVPDARRVASGEEVMRFSGTPYQVALAEERLVGILAKPSGIATAARHFVDRADGRLKVVSGAWKKLPYSQKEMIRHATAVGGAAPRIAEWPFAYLDKNFVAMLGGPLHALAAVDGLDEYRRVIQLGRSARGIAADAVDAALGGAGIIFVDTGVAGDVEDVAHALRAEGVRDRVELAFGGGIRLDDIDALAEMDLDIVDVGRPIVDAPLMDMRVSVLAAMEAERV